MNLLFIPPRILSILLLLVSITCVAVQYNDPDGLVWMLIYGYSVVVSTLAIFEVYGFWAFIGALAYLLGGIWVMPWAQLDSQLFGMPHWHMGPDSNEEAREAGGLFILSVWMFVVSWWWLKARTAKIRAGG